jgi:hypothetical protein
MGLDVIISGICELTPIPVKGGERADGRYEFPAEWLNQDEMSVFEFILPYNTSGGDSNFRNYSVSVM